MLEEDPVQETAAANAELPPPLQYPNNTNQVESSVSTMTITRPPGSETSSAFGRFSDVRKRLYELCLALLAVNRGDGERCAGRSTESSPDDSGGRCTRLSEEQSEDDAERRHEKDSSHIRVSSKAQRPGDRREVDGTARRLREGDEWVVKELRRVGESVKPVRVLCRVSLKSCSY